MQNLKIKNKKNNVFIYYALCFLLFMTTTLSIFLYNNNKHDLLEVCFVRYFIALILGILGHYYFVMKKKKVSIKKIFYVICIISGAILISIFIDNIFLINNVIEKFSTKLFLFIFIFCILISVIFLYFRRILDDNKTIVLIIILLGFLYAFELPAMSGIGWDDETHYRRALQVSQLGNTEYTKADVMIINRVHQKQGMKNMDVDKFERKINKHNNKNKVKLPYEKMQIGVLISYLPSAFFLFLGRGLSLPSSILYQFGKLGNVFFFAGIIYLALKQLKSGKIIIFIISLLPINFLLMTTYSYDTWGLCLTILSFSYLVGVIQDDTRRIDIKLLLKICLVSLLAFSAKPIYFCLILVFLIVKEKKLDYTLSLKKYRCVIFSLCIIVLLSFVIPFLLNGVGGNDMRGGTDVNSIEQIKFILCNPITYTKILLKFLIGYWSITGESYFFSELAYLGRISQFNNIIMIISFIIMFLDKEKVDNNVTTMKNRIVALSLCFLASVFVATALYVAFTPVQYNTILGCQKRYLFPFLFLVFYFLSDFKFISKFKRYIEYNKILFLCLIIYASYTLYALFTLCIVFYLL